MDASINSHSAQARQIIVFVWYEGTDALKEGEGICYNSDYGTATVANARRTNYVERPSTSNSRHFAGVSVRNYSAKSTGQYVEICNPGSVCNIALGVDTVLDTGFLTCQAGGAAGRFSDMGFIGRGSARPIQTVTAVLERVVDGTGSLLATDGKTLTVTDSDDFTVGDTVVFLAGENDGTGVFVPGKYSVGSITNKTTIVLSATALSTLTTGAISCSYYVYTGNPKCLARLMTGEESGLVEWITPPNTGTAGLTHMVGGVTYVNGGVTIGSADSDVTLADGTLYGEKKGFVLMGAMTTQAVTIDLATEGLNMAGTSMDEINAMAAAGDTAFLQWYGRWRTLMADGNSTEAT